MKDLETNIKKDFESNSDDKTKNRQDKIGRYLGIGIGVLGGVYLGFGPEPFKFVYNLFYNCLG